MEAPPEISDEEARQAARELFGVAGTARKLGGEKDSNHYLRLPSGAEYLLKISHPSEPIENIVFQTRALTHIAAVAPEIPVPRLHADADGRLMRRWGDEAGGRICRLFDWLPGTLLRSAEPSDRQAFALGSILARLAAALQSCPGHPSSRPLWDLCETARLSGLLCHVPAERRNAVRRALDIYQSDLVGELGKVRHQLVHNDLNPSNVLVADDDPCLVTGILDFGDLSHTALVNDVAIAASYQVLAADPLRRSVGLVRGYCSVLPLLGSELEILAKLIMTRLAVTLLITHWRAELHPGSRDYILRNNARAWVGLQALCGMPEGAAAASFRSVCA